MLIIEHKIQNLAPQKWQTTWVGYLGTYIAQSIERKFW
jgi:hypothetical protein